MSAAIFEIHAQDPAFVKNSASPRMSAAIFEIHAQDPAKAPGIFRHFPYIIGY
jgi:hypothetical protein